MTTNFFSPHSFVAGYVLINPGSGMGKNQDPGSGINITDPQLLIRHQMNRILSPDSLLRYIIMKLLFRNGEMASNHAGTEEHCVR
jgi:hypothetical protein